MAATARDLARVSRRFAHVWEGVTWHALAVNIGLRLAILVFTVDALINAADDRFAGKALGPRNVGILLGLSLLFPLLQAVRGQWKRYPMWYDNLYLSIFALDMAGNSLNLYNTVEWWDHVPHFHGPGALAIVLMGAFGMSVLAAAGLTTILHTALETQEYYGDVLLHTHNVKGIADTVNDELFALAGVLVYLFVFTRSLYLRRRRAPKPRG
ncbi:MAG TPA: hypothetical protein VIA63_10040 [Candidatus Limnocylindria bacterium]